MCPKCGINSSDKLVNDTAPQAFGCVNKQDLRIERCTACKRE